MKFFLSYEAHPKGGTICDPLMSKVGLLLSELEDIDYGDEIKEIAIISVIMPEEDYPYYPERRYISRKEKWADIRLHIDYKAFCKCMGKNAQKIYVDHILECIRVAGERAKGNFQTERLLEDVKAIFKREGLLEEQTNSE